MNPLPPEVLLLGAAFASTLCALFVYLANATRRR